MISDVSGFVRQIDHHGDDLVPVGTLIGDYAGTIRQNGAEFAKGKHVGIVRILAQGDQRLNVWLEISPEEQEALSRFLVEYKVDKEICFATKGKLFFAEETTGDMHHWKFRFRRKDGDGVLQSVREGSLSVHMRDINLLMEEYASCFDPSCSPFHEAPWTASSEETEQILAKVKELRPVGCDDLIPWLERAVAEYDGIGFDGI